MYLNDGNFAKAVEVADDIEDKSQSLVTWMSRVNEKLEFNNAISEISARSLALMKVNHIKTAE